MYFILSIYTDRTLKNVVCSRNIIGSYRLSTSSQGTGCVLHTYSKMVETPQMMIYVKFIRFEGISVGHIMKLIEYFISIELGRLPQANLPWYIRETDSQNRRPNM